MADRVPSSAAPAAPLSDAALQRFLGYRIRRAWSVILRDLAQSLKPFELRMVTYTALLMIEANPGIRQSQLADAMEIERPNLVAIVEELEGRDLIARDRVASDRRTYALRTTPAGRSLCARATEAVEAHEARLFAGLDAGTRREIAAAMATIHRNGGRT